MLLGTSWVLRAQDLTVSGTVTGGDGGPIPGANVLLKGTTIGTVTDIDGNYRLPVPDEAGAVLSYSFIGYATIEEEVNGRSTINVSLDPDVSELSEVVVVGYGTQLKTDVTGNIAQVSGEELENLPVPSIEQAIQGRAAGVFVEAGNGKLGQGIKVRVRGAASVSASNDPLYVVDGVIITSNNLSSTDAATNPLSDINFNDVESVQVLKDASAAAIYGARAANGVVLITTKRGKSGKTRFNVGYMKGWSSPTRTAEWLNGPQYYQAFREAFDNTDAIIQRDFPGDDFGSFNYGEPGLTFDEVLDFELGDWDATVNDYWPDQAYRDDAGLDQIDLSASGGNEKTQFYSSLQYTDQRGILINNNFERLSARINVDHQASDRLKIGLNFNLARSVNDRLSDDNQFTTPMQLLALPPIQPFRNENGTLNENTVYFNGLIKKENSSFTTTVFRNITNLFAEISLFPNLTFRTEVNADVLTQNEEFFDGREVDAQTGYINGGGESRWVNVQNYSTNNFFTYRNNVSERHDLEVVGGMTFQTVMEDGTSVEAQTFPLDAFRQLASASTIIGGRSDATDYTFLSYFARANYKFYNRYLLSLSGRIDGSSKFGENEKYGFFPAASAGWIVSEEGFLQSNVLSFLKLRASVGLTGNAPTQNFASLGTFDAVTYDVLGGIVPGQLANPNLKWETTLQTDIGIDFGLFNDRITGELDYYVKNTTDVLLNSNVPGTSGFLRQFVNVGALENKGFEVLINSTNMTGAFSWSTSLNFALNRNKITDLNDNVIEGGYINRAVEGQPIGVFFAQEYAGVDPENGDALYYLNRDATGEELADETVFTVNHLGNRLVTSNYSLAERVVVGDPNPDWIGGITNNLSYKGLDLSFLFQFVQGNDVYNGGGRFQRADFAYFDNHLVQDWEDAWREPGDITDVPEARLFFGNGDQVSSRYLQDASFVRLKTLTLGYNLPSFLLERLSMQNIRVYVSAQNLLTFTEYDLNDPEVNTDYLAGNIGQGNDFYAAPQAKTVSVGIKLGF